LVTFDAGSNPVTVYLAFDGAGPRPAVSTGQAFSSYTSSSALTATHPTVPTFALARATNVTGSVSIGGTLSGGAGARVAYLVIVVAN
jgi:hypothetical protein